MSKKKGLGKDVNRSQEIMKDLLDALYAFDKMPLKAGLMSTGLDQDAKDEFVKQIDDAKETAKKLMNTVENLGEKVRGVRTDRSSRFASQVVRRFLSDRP